MPQCDNLLLFLCSGAAKAGNTKLSYRIASQLETRGIGEIGSLQDLSMQKSLLPQMQRRMIFINDCRSSCVKILMHGFDADKYVYVDVSAHLMDAEFDIDGFIESSILSPMQQKWNCQSENRIAHSL